MAPARRASPALVLRERRVAARSLAGDGGARHRERDDARRDRPFRHATRAPAHRSARRSRPTSARCSIDSARALDAVLCGHSHYDHLLDAPLVARATGAKLVGSRTTCAFGRAAGLTESQLVEIPPAGAQSRCRRPRRSLRAEPARADPLRARAVPRRGEARAFAPGARGELPDGGRVRHPDPLR